MTSVYKYTFAMLVKLKCLIHKRCGSTHLCSMQLEHSHQHQLQLHLTARFLDDDQLGSQILRVQALSRSPVGVPVAASGAFFCLTVTRFAHSHQRITNRTTNGMGSNWPPIDLSVSIESSRNSLTCLQPQLCPKFQHGFGNGESTRIFPQSLQVEGPLLTSHLHGLPLGDSPSIWFRLPQNPSQQPLSRGPVVEKCQHQLQPCTQTCIHITLTCQFQVNMIPSVHYSIRFHHSKTKCQYRSPWKNGRGRLDRCTGKKHIHQKSFNGLEALAKKRRGVQYESVITAIIYNQLAFTQSNCFRISFAVGLHILLVRSARIHLQHFHHEY